MNKYRDCILIVSEDAALRTVAVGFFRQRGIHDNQFYIAPFKRGWPDVFDSIPEYVNLLKTFKKMRVIILIDYDRNKNRYDDFINEVDEDVRERFFILGPLNNVEKLKKCCGASSFENLGALLELDTQTKNSPDSKWQCEELKDFLPEAQRLCENVKDFFGDKFRQSSLAGLLPAWRHKCSGCPQ